MKSSIFLAASCALLASATPVAKRDTVTDVVVEWYTVTVEGAAPEATRPVNMKHNGNDRPSRPRTSSGTAQADPTPTKPAVVYVTQTIRPDQPEQPETSKKPPVSSTKPAVVSPSASVVKDPATPAPSGMASTALAAHNLHRANHSAPAMSWLDEIAGYASKTAATCKFAHDMDQGSGKYGQNIAMWATSNNAAALGESGAIGMATHDMWYNGEINNYKSNFYGKDSPDMSQFESWGHFSQVVWKDSNQLGCATKLCPKGTMYADMEAWYMVCNYRPAGNMGGAYGKNVLQPLGKATVTN